MIKKEKRKKRKKTRRKDERRKGIKRFCTTEAYRQNQANILPTHQQPRYMQDIDYECFPKEVC